jgi:crotonobetainyl-CoA:carnitine CoA-transferase CaiB-like acyl-CoA transferase
VVDVAMIDTVYPTLASNLSGWYRDGTAPPTGNGHGGGAISPYNVYPARDGYLAIIVVSEQQWRNLCGAMERPDLAEDERFRSNGRRYHNLEELDAIIGKWTSMMSRADVVARLHAAKVPVAAVRGVGEMVEDRHLHERGALARLHHPQLGDVVVPHSPLRYRESALAALEPSPALGQHNAEVYGGLLGLSTAELQELSASGVI